MTCLDKAAVGRAVADARVCTGHQAFGATVGHADSYGKSLGVVVGNWGIGRKVVTIGAKIGDTYVMNWEHRGEIWNKFSC
jgi:hypothetical protein